MNFLVGFLHLDPHLMHAIACVQFGMLIDKWPCCPPHQGILPSCTHQSDWIDGSVQFRSQANEKLLQSDLLCSTSPPSVHFEGHLSLRDSVGFKRGFPCLFSLFIHGNFLLFSCNKELKASPYTKNKN